MKQVIKRLSKFKNWVWYGFKTNINQFVVVSLRASMVALILFMALFLFYFTNDKYLHLFDSNNSSLIEQNNPNYNEALHNTISENNNSNSNNMVYSCFDRIDNGTLLTLLSILIAFAGLLAYIFHYLVRDSIHEELKIMARDERLASKAEMQLTTSNIFSKLHELTEEIEKEEEKEEELAQNKGQQHTPCRVFNVFKSNSFLNRAIKHDELAVQLIKKITNTDNYNDVISKVSNNRGYNIYLKYKRWEKLTKDLKEDDIKKMVLEFKAKDINIEVSDGEIQTALKAKCKLRELIANEDYYLYEGVDPDYHIKAWRDTCTKIDALVETSPRWRKIQDEI